jgi:hypothetical protein
MANVPLPPFLVLFVKEDRRNVSGIIRDRRRDRSCLRPLMAFVRILASFALVPRAPVRDERDRVAHARRASRSWGVPAIAGRLSDA